MRTTCPRIAGGATQVVKLEDLIALRREFILDIKISCLLILVLLNCHARKLVDDLSPGDDEAFNL
jgi:hypothetical protein